MTALSNNDTKPKLLFFADPIPYTLIIYPPFQHLSKSPGLRYNVAHINKSWFAAKRTILPHAI